MKMKKVPHIQLVAKLTLASLTFPCSSGSSLLGFLIARPLSRRFGCPFPPIFIGSKGGSYIGGTIGAVTIFPGVVVSAFLFRLFLG